MRELGAARVALLFSAGPAGCVSTRETPLAPDMVRAPFPADDGEGVRDPLDSRRAVCRSSEGPRQAISCGDLPSLVVANYHLLAVTQCVISSLGRLKPLGPSILYISARLRR